MTRDPLPSAGASQFYQMGKWCVLGVPILWLLYAAWVVDIEYFDGYEVLGNTAYFLGEHPRFILTRAPLMAILMIPARLLSTYYQLERLDVRPYHVESAILHSVYLILVLQFLERLYGKRPAVLVAFLSTILCFGFYSYGIFLSHDIFPGLILLLMVLAGEAYHSRPGRRAWMMLMLSGTAAVLIKQTYGIFWIALLAAKMVQGTMARPNERRAYLRTLCHLFPAAVCSAVIYWLVMGGILRANFPDSASLIRPLLQMQIVMGEYEGTGFTFPWWGYLRNFHFYGTLTALLILPGIIMALRAPGRLQTCALVWVITCGFLHMLSMREVRYLLVLAPLSALLIVPPLRWLLTHRRYGFLVIVLLATDLTVDIPEALRIREPFYQQSQLKAYLSAWETEIAPEDTIIMTPFISTMPARQSPFAGDRYHRLFHFGVRHVSILWFKMTRPVFEVRQHHRLKTLAGEYPHSALLAANGMLVNGTGLLAGPPENLERFFQVAAVAERLPIQPSRLQWSFEAETGNVVLFRHAQFARVAPEYVFPCLVDVAEQAVYPIIAKGMGQYEVEGLHTLPSPDALSSWEIRGYRIVAYCVPVKDRLGTALMVPGSK